MSVFDFPRINVQGTIRLNPGTANNDDYAANATLPKEWNAMAGQPLGLIDSKNVQARTYGMDDDNFIAWVQKAQKFDVTPGMSPEIIPAEWNYYGDMSSKQVKISVTGVQAGDSGVDLSVCENVELAYKGSITDINPEGSPPATQFFIEELTLGDADAPLIQAELNKGVGQWINFYRNVNIRADGGAGSYVYHALIGAKVNIPGWENLNADGVIFRYYLYRANLVNEDGATNAGIEKIYEKKGTNPKDLELVGTFAPYYANEKITAAPTGRLMTWNTPNIKTENKNNNGVPDPDDKDITLVALGPGVVHQNGNLLTADFSGTFPDNMQDDGTNPKYCFGPVSLVAFNGSETAEIGPIKYEKTDYGDSIGWLFDFDLSKNKEASDLLAKDGTALKLVSNEYGDVLQETDYYFVSNQQAVYAEQHGTGKLFLNNGTDEPATLAVYHRGVALTAENCPPITVWQYRSVPLESPGDAEPISTNYLPGQHLEVDTEKPGNRLLTFTINDTEAPPAGFPPKSYSTFMMPPYVTNSPQISIRILPNEDYSQYFVNPDSDEPVGNALLTFDIVYEHVLRAYYLLYPVMDFLPLNQPGKVAQSAQSIIDRTDMALWMSTQYMPRTRDLSNSRRRLLQAWCRKAILEGQE